MVRFKSMTKIYFFSLVSVAFIHTPVAFLFKASAMEKSYSFQTAISVALGMYLPRTDMRDTVYNLIIFWCYARYAVIT